MHHRRPFILLEVLLAIAVVAIFAAPLMRLPIRHYQVQIRRLEAFEYQRIADWTFSEIKEFLLKEAIPWEQLPSKGQSLTQTLPDSKLIVPRLKSRAIHRSFTLICKGEKEGPHGELFRLYRIEVGIDQKVFRYRLIVQRLKRE